MKSIDVRYIYNAEYFLGSVDGHREFSDFDADYDALFDRYKRNVDALDLKPIDKYLEIGCGRGEIVMYHAKKGGEGLGVDYSKDAISLALKKKKRLGLQCDFQVSSFSEIKIGRKWDKILASEFIEHISEEEGWCFFEKAYELLSPGGKLVVFTYPNRLQRIFGYPLRRFYYLIVKQKILPKLQDDMLHEHFHKFHLNEQSIISLAKFAKTTGFKIEYIGYDNPASKTVLGYIIDVTPLKHIFRNNLLLVAIK